MMGEAGTCHHPPPSVSPVNSWPYRAMNVIMPSSSSPFGSRSGPLPGKSRRPRRAMRSPDLSCVAGPLNVSPRTPVQSRDTVLDEHRLAPCRQRGSPELNKACAKPANRVEPPTRSPLEPSSRVPRTGPLREFPAGDGGRNGLGRTRPSWPTRWIRPPLIGRDPWQPRRLSGSGVGRRPFRVVGRQDRGTRRFGSLRQCRSGGRCPDVGSYRY